MDSSPGSTKTHSAYRRCDRTAATILGVDSDTVLKHPFVPHPPLQSAAAAAVSTSDVATITPLVCLVAFATDDDVTRGHVCRLTTNRRPCSDNSSAI